MYLIIVFGSLCNTLLISVLGRFLGRQAVIYSCISTLLLLSSLVLLASTEILLNNNTIVIHLYTLFLINEVQVDIAFLFDQLTVIMLLVVLLISTFVHIFTGGYMSHDPYIVRFYAFLGFFTFFMIILVTSDNFLQLFVG
jgi:NADH:ubiquinone oxidoreductase subunit 5 (subunit L)/multisubunit Na+/H+ antiporter MnhA subunit